MLLAWECILVHTAPGPVGAVVVLVFCVGVGFVVVVLDFCVGVVFAVVLVVFFVVVEVGFGIG
jgi:hypothetical protein